MIKLSLLSTLLFFSAALYSQNTFCYGNLEGNAGKSVVEVSDGYIFTGIKRSKVYQIGEKDMDIFIQKRGVKGEMIWTKDIKLKKTNNVNSLILVDGGYLMFAGSAGKASNMDACLFKTNSKGEMIWEEFYGGEKNDKANCVIKTDDKGFLIVGSTASKGAGGEDIYIIKTDSKGKLIWEKTYGGKKNDEASFVTQTNSGDYMIAANSKSFGNGSDIYLIKINNKGEKIWEKTYGGKKKDRVECIRQTSFGGYVLIGSSKSYKDCLGEDILLLKIDQEGKEEWKKLFGNSNADKGFFIEETPEGGYILSCELSYSPFQEGGAYIIKQIKQGR